MIIVNGKKLKNNWLVNRWIEGEEPLPPVTVTINTELSIQDFLSKLRAGEATAGEISVRVGVTDPEDPLALLPLAVNAGYRPGAYHPRAPEPEMPPISRERVPGTRDWREYNLAGVAGMYIEDALGVLPTLWAEDMPLSRKKELSELADDIYIEDFDDAVRTSGDNPLPEAGDLLDYEKMNPYEKRAIRDSEENGVFAIELVRACRKIFPDYRVDPALVARSKRLMPKYVAGPEDGIGSRVAAVLDSLGYEFLARVCRSQAEDFRREGVLDPLYGALFGKERGAAVPTARALTTLQTVTWIVDTCRNGFTGGPVIPFLYGGDPGSFDINAPVIMTPGIARALAADGSGKGSVLSPKKKAIIKKEQKQNARRKVNSSERGREGALGYKVNSSERGREGTLGCEDENESDYRKRVSGLMDDTVRYVMKLERSRLPAERRVYPGSERDFPLCYTTIQGTEKIKHMFTERFGRFPDIVAQWSVTIKVIRGARPWNNIRELVDNFNYRSVRVIAKTDSRVLMALSTSVDFRNVPKSHIDVFASRGMSLELASAPQFIAWYNKTGKNATPGQLWDVLDVMDRGPLPAIEPDMPAEDLIRMGKRQLALDDMEHLEAEFGYDFKKNTVDIPGADIKTRTRGIDAYILPPDDLRNFTVGYDTCCCQVAEEAGESCVYMATCDPLAGIFVIECGERILGQAFIWYNPQKDFLAFDNIEWANDRDVHKYMDVLEDWCAASPIKNIAVGVGNNEKMSDIGIPLPAGMRPGDVVVYDDDDVYTDFNENARMLKRDGGITIYTPPDTPVAGEILIFDEANCPEGTRDGVPGHEEEMPILYEDSYPPKQDGSGRDI